MDSLERNLQQASVSLKGKVILDRLERWISRAAEIQVAELPTTRPCVGYAGNGFLNCEPDGGVEFRVVMRLRPGNDLKAVRTEQGYQIQLAPWEVNP